MPMSVMKDPKLIEIENSQNALKPITTKRRKLNKISSSSKVKQPIKFHDGSTKCTNLTPTSSALLTSPRTNYMSMGFSQAAKQKMTSKKLLPTTMSTMETPVLVKELRGTSAFSYNLQQTASVDQSNRMLQVPNSVIPY